MARRAILCGVPEYTLDVVHSSAAKEEPEPPNVAKASVSPDEQASISAEEIDKYKEVKKAAKKERVDAAVEGNKTGTDPRDFSFKWMPYYRYTELDNGLIQQDLTAFGTVPFSPELGMFFEVPVAQYRDFSDIEGVAAGTDAIGVGDIDLKFMWNPKALGFNFGKDGTKSGSWLFGTDFVLPTATDDLLAGDALLFAPIVGFVVGHAIAWIFCHVESLLLRCLQGG